MTPESPQSLTPDSRIELNDDELKAIGPIVLGDARLGEVLAALLWGVIDEDDNVGATSPKAGTSHEFWKRSALSFAPEYKTNLQDEMFDWIRKAESAHRQRNSIVHSALVRLNPDQEQLITCESFRARMRHSWRLCPSSQPPWIL